MDWTPFLAWLATQPQPIQDVLTGATGDLTGGLASQAVVALLGQASGRVRKQFAPTPQQEALHRAMARAMVETLAEQIDDPLVLAEVLGHFTQWLKRESVAVELAQVIDPNPTVNLDLDLLEAEFERAGFAADLLGDEVEFSTIMAGFVRSFYDAACHEPELTPAIELQLLRGMAEQLVTLAAENRRQAATLRAIERRLAQMARFDLDELERAYLTGLYSECNRLPLATADDPADMARARQPRLQRVYVDLRTTENATLDAVLDRLGIGGAQRSRAKRLLAEALPGERTGRGAAPAPEPMLPELRRLDGRQLDDLAKRLEIDRARVQASLATLTPVEIMQRQPEPQLVLLGNPGSGKSTLTRRLSSGLAGLAHSDLRRQWSDEEVIWAEQLADLFGRRLLPVRVVLSTWAKHLPAHATGCAADLVAECMRLLLQTTPADAERQAAHFEARLLADPPTVLLLLDGLDEVTDARQRDLLLDAVRDFCAHYPRTPLLVTCRVRPYETLRHAGQALPLPAATLDALELDAIVRFIERWHAELVWAGIYSEEGAAEAAQRLITALHDERRKELREMAGTPLLLTMMARTNHKHGLPDSRAELYERFVKLLLWEWERQRQDERGRENALDALLNEAGIHKNDLERGLNELAYSVHGADGGRDTVEIGQERLCTALEALLPGDKRDPEMAGRARTWALRMLGLIGERSGLIVDLGEGRFRFTHRTFQEYLAARWMATGRLLPKFREHIDSETWREAIFLALGYLTRVHDRYEDALGVYDNLLKETVDADTARRRLLLLGEAFVRQDGPSWAGKTDDVARAGEVLRLLPQRLTAVMVDRDVLPRERLLAADLGVEPPGLDDFIAVPGLPGVRMAKYPVTVKQYRRFVEAGGYDRGQPWWTQAAIREIERWRGGEWPDAPEYWDDDRFNHSTQPVVGVSWYEARAYCAWLTDRLRALPAAEGGIGAGEQVALPAEAEWVQAARGGQPAPADENEDYPWRGPFATWRANTEEQQPTDLGQTSPVHMYPGGATDAGIFDLTGNVLEWTRDKTMSDTYVLKGGGWFLPPELARPAARDGDFPWVRYHSWGFRVVVVPISRIGSDS